MLVHALLAQSRWPADDKLGELHAVGSLIGLSCVSSASNLNEEGGERMEGADGKVAGDERLYTCQRIGLADGIAPRRHTKRGGW